MISNVSVAAESRNRHSLIRGIVLEVVLMAEGGILIKLTSTLIYLPDGSTATEIPDDRSIGARHSSLNKYSML